MRTNNLERTRHRLETVTALPEWAKAEHMTASYALIELWKIEKTPSRADASAPGIRFRKKIAGSLHALANIIYNASFEVAHQ